MEIQKIGVVLRNNPAEVKVEWTSLLFDMAALVGQTLLVAPTAGGSIPDVLASAIAVLKAVSLNDPVETRALGLFALSLAGAVTSLVPQNGRDMDHHTRELARQLSKALLKEVADGQHVVDLSFFDSPTSNSLYSAIREHTVALIAAARGQSISVDLQAKLDSAFSASIFRSWQRRPDYFNPILAALANPGSDLAQMQIDWSNYRARLVESFTVRPLFGQLDRKASLSDIYIGLDAVHKRKSADGREVATRVNLHENIDTWLEEDDSADAVRLVFGGPGSGKSSFAKALAASLAERADKRPIFVELQHTNALGDLRQAIEQRLVVDQELFSSDPLSERDDNRRFVLIFDGLDELVVPGSAAATRVADGFVVSLKALLRNLNSAGKCRAKVIVTGRTAIMQSFARSMEVSSRAALEVRGFFSDDDGGVVDLRPQWWARFSAAYHHSPEVPPALIAEELEEVTNEPLLCFLLALSGYLTEGWEEAADNTNRIYARLIGEVWERRWGEGAPGGRVGPALSMRSREDFDLLMETMALAAWWGGENRVATKSSFDLALIATGASDIWTKFIADEGDDLSNLALTFYFRRADTDSQGFEFTHKTFGEYLVSKFLIKQVTTKVALPLRARDIDKAEASDRWCRYAVQGAPHFGITPFLRNEARLLPLDLIRLSIEELTGWLSHVVANGLPVHHRSGEEFRRLEDKNVCGQANIVACLSSLARASDHLGTETDWAISVRWKSSAEVARLIRNIADIGAQGDSVEVDFYRFDFGAETNGSFANVFVPDSFFEYSNWRGAMVTNGYFGGADLSKANLTETYLLDVGFEGCNLAEANFSSAVLTGSSFRGADLRGTNFEGANLSEVRLDRATMDLGWWELVDLETFEVPPIGTPNFWVDGGEMEPGSNGYPDLAVIYAGKFAAMQASREANRAEIKEPSKPDA